MSQAFCDFSVEPIERASEAWQCWYRLAFTQGLSYKLKLKLLTHFTWVEAIFSANRLDLVALIGESPTSALLSEHGLNDGGPLVT